MEQSGPASGPSGSSTLTDPVPPRGRPARGPDPPDVPGPSEGTRPDARAFRGRPLQPGDRRPRAEARTVAARHPGRRQRARGASSRRTSAPSRGSVRSPPGEGPRDSRPPPRQAFPHSGGGCGRQGVVGRDPPPARPSGGRCHAGTAPQGTGGDTGPPGIPGGLRGRGATDPKREQILRPPDDLPDPRVRSHERPGAVRRRRRERRRRDTVGPPQGGIAFSVGGIAHVPGARVVENPVALARAVGALVGIPL